MTLRDLAKMELSGAGYRVIDANRSNYLEKPFTLIYAGKSTAIHEYGDCKVVAFEPTGDGNIMVYVKQTEEG